MENMDFALETRLVRASQYFNRCVDKVYATSLNGDIISFKKITHQSEYHGQYLSLWALMALKPNDELIHGRICIQNAYPEHSWVRFQFENEWYIYTCISRHIYPETIYADEYQPHDITVQQTQRELLDQVLTAEYAYQINEHMWQFKPNLCLPPMLEEAIGGFEFTALDMARITIFEQKVTNFIGYGCHVRI